MTGLFSHAQPIAGLVGGLLIGTAAAVMLLGLGRIAGVSGLAARAVGLSDAGAPRSIALAFMLGLPFGALLATHITDVTPGRFPALGLLIAGGLLVGFGTRLGSGCTSGHGICGLARLSPRSMVATLLFMASGFATIAIMRQAGVL